MEFELEILVIKVFGIFVFFYNNGYVNGLFEGFYIVSMNLWWGENVISYKFYEDGVLIDMQKLIYNVFMVQFVQMKIIGKINGIYMYVVELMNDKGIIWS